MSDVSEKEKELSDIELCYKAMGLSFSDNPEQVERTYRKLKDEYTKAMHSSDLAARGSASGNLKQLEELFTTITGSLIYKDYAKEHEKYKELKAEQSAARKLKQPTAVNGALIVCPHCNKQIASNLKVCIYCHGKIATPMGPLMENMLSTKNIIVVTIIVVTIITGVVFMSK